MSFDPKNTSFSLGGIAMMIKIRYFSNEALFEK